MLPGDIASLRSDGGIISVGTNTEITGSLNISGGASGSFSGSFQGDGSGLTGVTATAFPFTGSAIITGSLVVTGSVDVGSTSAQSKFIAGWFNRLGSFTNINQIPPATAILASTGTGTFNANQTTNFLAANSGFNIDSTFGSANTLIAGLGNRLGPGTNIYNSGIIASQACQIVGGNIVGGIIIGGELSVIESSQNYHPSAIVGARSATIKSNHTGSVILGGSGLQTTGPGQVVVPRLLISGSGGIQFIDGTTQTTAFTTSSLMVTGSVAGNVLTFTKGDASTFSLTVDTGSAGTTPDLQSVTSVGSTTSASISITDGGNLMVHNEGGNADLIVTSDGSNTYNSTIRLGGGPFGGGNGFFLEMLPGDIANLRSDGGLITIGSNTQVTGSVSISTVMNLAPQDPLPGGNLGDIAVSGSSGAANVYFYDGTAWVAMI